MNSSNATDLLITANEYGVTLTHVQTGKARHIPTAAVDFVIGNMNSDLDCNMGVTPLMAFNWTADYLRTWVKQGGARRSMMKAVA